MSRECSTTKQIITSLLKGGSHLRSCLARIWQTRRRNRRRRKKVERPFFLYSRKNGKLTRTWRKTYALCMAIWSQPVKGTITTSYYDEGVLNARRAEGFSGTY